MIDEWYDEAREEMELLLPLIKTKERMVRSLFVLYVTKKGDEKQKAKEKIERVLSYYRAKTLNFEKPLLAIPEEGKSKGEIGIGKLMWGDEVLYPFAISKDELNRHFLITAQAGSGKTTLVVNIMAELMRQNIPFLVTDFKRDYRHLIKNFPRLIVINWKDLRINPFIPPPKVDFIEWKQQVMHIFGYVEGIWTASTHYVLDIVDDVYERKRGLTCLRDILDEIEAMNERNSKLAEYWGVVYNRVKGMISKMGDTIATPDTIDVEKLLDHPVVIEVDGLGREEASFVILWFCYWIYMYRKANNHRSKRMGLRHVLVLDEAKRFFTGSEQYSAAVRDYAGIAPADLIADEIRDYCEAVIAADQEPTKLSDSLKANTYTKMTGNLGNGIDIENIAKSMGLEDRERKVINNLGRGEWLVKLSDRYTKPFMLKTEDFPLDKDVTDEEVRNRSRPILDKLIIRNGQLRLEAPEVEQVNIELSEDGLMLLKHANGYPFMSVTKRAENLQISSRRMDAAKDELLQKRLAEETPIRIWAHAPIKLLGLTSLAKALLKKQGVETKLWETIGNVGIEHAYYQSYIGRIFGNEGFDVQYEATIGKRRYDLLVSRPDKRMGIEIELSSNDIEHKLEDMEGIDELVIITNSTDNVLRMEEKARKTKNRGRIRVMTMRGFLEKLGGNKESESGTKGQDESGNKGGNKGTSIGAE